MSILRKWVSVFLCAAMFLSLVPVTETRADPGPPFYTKTVEVTVLAYDVNEKKEVPVPGAIVTLTQAKEVLVEAVADEEGKAVLSLEGIDPEVLEGATVQACYTVARGKGMPASDRDKLFQNFPKDENGEYYRFEYQLHSEIIDTNGNWRGQLLPVSTRGQMDVVFLIDGTGSMDDNMENVKQNLETYINDMKDLGLDIRYSVIEYRDVVFDEMPVLHVEDGVHWFRDADTVVQILNGIVPDGGGDAESETLGDALDYILLDDDMGYRRDSYRFAIAVTDAENYFENRYGASVWESNLNEDLKRENIAMSVVTEAELDEEYQLLYEGTGGRFFDIESQSFGSELYQLTRQIVQSETAKMELKLSEPRMLVNLSICYLADDATSQSDEYLENVKNLMDTYSRTMAQATDGHVYVDHVLVFTADSVANFFDLTDLACMADIQMQTKESETNGTKLRSNAHVNGFYARETYDASSNTSWFENAKSLNLSQYSGKDIYSRIQLSGTLGGGWNYSFIKVPVLYAETMMHESGHYLFGFFDEYVDQTKTLWEKKGDKQEADEKNAAAAKGEKYEPRKPEELEDLNRELNDKPYGCFGLMDNQHEDIEMSKTGTEYYYLGNYFSDYPSTTYHYNVYWASCEDVLADLLEKGQTFAQGEKILKSAYTHLVEPVFSSPYLAHYTKAPYGPTAADREAEYSYAGLEAEDFTVLEVEREAADGETGGGLPWDNGNQGGPVGQMENADALEAAETIEAIGKLGSLPGKDGFTIEVEEEEAGATYSLYLRKQGEAAFSKIELARQENGPLTADLVLSGGDLAEVLVAKETDGKVLYNTYYLESSKPATGYLYTSLDGKVGAYGTSDEEASYTFLADNTTYENGEYISLNQATQVYTGGVPMTGGEIYSVASCTADVDFTSICWFKFDGENWIALPTDYDTEEDLNIGARADLTGEGLYVLMGKKAVSGAAEEPSFLSYEPSQTVDGRITLSFEDLNENSKFYYVYVSEDLDEDPETEKDEALLQVYEADKCITNEDNETVLTLNLHDRGKAFQVSVEVVLEDGSRSKRASILATAPEADRDGDGIPDWYLDKYGLWLDNEAAIAGSDPDDDGLTTLEEYLAGTNPVIAEKAEPEETPEQIIARQNALIAELQAKLTEYSDLVVAQQGVLDKNRRELEYLQQEIARLEALIRQGGKPEGKR